MFHTAFWSTVSALYHLSQSGNPQGVPPWLVRGVRVVKLLKKRPKKG